MGRALVVVAAVTLGLSAAALAVILFRSATGSFLHVSKTRWFALIAIPFGVALHGYRRRSVNASGAASGIVVAFALLLAHSGFVTALLFFFLSASKATRWKEAEKKRIEGKNFKAGGARDWIQVMCNGGVAMTAALLYLLDSNAQDLPVDLASNPRASVFSLAVLGSLACCCGDTWASELSSARTHVDPVLVTTCATVPRGTNGGITLWGTAMSGLGGLFTGLGFWLGTVLANASVDFSGQLATLALAGAAAGLFGSFVDSLLGATLQYSGVDERSGAIVESPGPGVRHISGTDFMDNHSVNALSSVITAIALPVVFNAVL